MLRVGVASKGDKVTNLSSDLFVQEVQKDERVEMKLLNFSMMKVVMSNDLGMEFYFNGEKFKAEEFDVIIIRDVLVALRHALNFVDYCKEKGIFVFDNNFSNMKYLINKKRDFHALIRAGIRVPKTFFFISEEILEKEDIEFPVVIKPNHMGQGGGVKIAKNKEEIFQIIHSYEKPDIKKLILQEFIDYEHDLRVLVVGDKVVGTMKRIPKEGDFRANFSLGGTVAPYELDEEGKDLAIRAKNATGLDVSGVDILIDKSGQKYILETNRSPGVEGITEAMNENITKVWLDYILEKYAAWVEAG